MYSFVIQVCRVVYQYFPFVGFNFIKCDSFIVYRRLPVWFPRFLHTIIGAQCPNPSWRHPRRWSRSNTHSDVSEVCREYQTRLLGPTWPVGGGFNWQPLADVVYQRMDDAGGVEQMLDAGELGWRAFWDPGGGGGDWQTGPSGRMRGKDMRKSGGQTEPERCEGSAVRPLDLVPSRCLCFHICAMMHQLIITINLHADFRPWYLPTSIYCF